MKKVIQIKIKEKVKINYGVVLFDIQKVSWKLLKFFEF